METTSGTRPSGPTPAPTVDDLARWRAMGVIDAAQEATMRADLAARRTPAAGGLQALAGRLSGEAIARYLGAFLVLFAATIFLGREYARTDSDARWIVSIAGLALLAGVGAALRRVGQSLGGNLLLFVAAAVVPLLAHDLLIAAGRWPEETGAASFVASATPPWWVVEAAALVAAGVVLAATRFPLTTLLAAIWTWASLNDLLTTGGGPQLDSRHDRLLGGVTALALVAAAVAVDRRGWRTHALWLHLVGGGLATLLLGGLALDTGGIGGALFLAYALALVVASVLLDRRVLLVFGVGGIYVDIAYLAFEVFHSAAAFSLALAAIGLSLVLVAGWFRRGGWGRLRGLTAHPRQPQGG